MQTNVVSMSVVMQVWEAIDHLYRDTAKNVTRPNVREVLGKRVSRTSVFYAFDVLTEAGVLRKVHRGGNLAKKPGRPAERFWVVGVFVWPEYEWVEERVTAHYERRGYARS